MSAANDTIFALSSGRGRAGVAVIRVSGPMAHAIVTRLCHKPVIPGKVSYRDITDPETKLAIDKGLVFTFTQPHSFTGEDMAEFQTHGAPIIIELMHRALCQAGARPAEAGEFTLRAFRNSKVDLVQAEAIGDLIDAETSLQHKQAMKQFAGQLSARAAEWYQHLLAIMVPLEAGIDFPDEGDVPTAIEEQALPVIEQMISQLEHHLQQAKAGRRIREGFSIILLGRPNAGKSSLLNWLAQSDVAIVSAIPGTTRDLVQARLDIAGVPVTLIDTAGLRAVSGDVVEREGMRRARQKAKEADMRLFIVSSEEEAVSEELIADFTSGDKIIINKEDLGAGPVIAPPYNNDVVSISIKENRGVDQLLQILERTVAVAAGSGEGEVILTRQRHQYLIEQTVTHLKRSLEILAVQPELAAEDVRLAARALAAISGNIDVEDVLGEIFSSFCIGK
ncbi:MAG: tRNA uridine-5-carboxymethylaminomethyl(34) synthesis GTPase MnmE [bacterium]